MENSQSMTIGNQLIAGYVLLTRIAWHQYTSSSDAVEVIGEARLNIFKQMSSFERQMAWDLSDALNLHRM